MQKFTPDVIPFHKKNKLSAKNNAICFILYFNEGSSVHRRKYFSKNFFNDV